MPTISSTEGEQAARPEAAPCPICGGMGYVREDVPVGHPNFGKLFPCRCKAAELEQRRLDQLRAVSNLYHLSHMTFNTFVPGGYGLPPDKADNLREVYEEARRYAEHPDRWLILLGGYGCGKTHLAAAIANSAMEHGQPVLFVTVPDLLDYLRATYSPDSPVRYDERFDQVRNAPLLVLDDLGTQNATSWAMEKLFQILNYRYNARLPTVVTSNYQPEEIDMRIRSRLFDPDVATIKTILAPDFRRSGVSQELSDMSSLALYNDMTFEAFDLRADELPPEERANLKRIYTICQEFAGDPDGWLVLTGEYGCGKTHLAASIANRRAAAGFPVLFIVVRDLLDHLRATFGPTSQVRFDQRFEEVRTAPLLILDDFGTQSTSPWAQEKLYQIFNYRYNARLPTVVTMSIEVDDVHPRIRTRMLDVQRSTVFAIIAPSYRGAPPRWRERRKWGRNQAKE